MGVALRARSKLGRLGVALSLAAAILAGAAGTAAARADGSRQLALAAAPATGAFGLDLLRVAPPGNVVLSPDSVANALAMVGTGAGGQTAAQIARALELSSPRAFPAVGSLQSTIMRELASAGAGNPGAATLEIANTLFLQQGFSPLAPFLAGLQQYFAAASPQSVDFAHDPAAAMEAINAWVDAHTGGIIPRLLSAPLPQATLLALANAIYLKASWQDPFRPGETRPEPFHGTQGTSSTELMHETDELAYGRGRGYAAIELPYAASELSLAVLLPVGESLASLELGLTSARLRAILQGLSPRSVSVSLPRFHLSTRTELEDSLKALGMTDAFSEHADFSRISAAPLQIGNVIHAADFRVDEEGTVAAAATVITVEPSSAERAPRAIQFDADRPFLFFLRDERSGAVLFAGRLSEPEPGGE